MREFVMMLSKISLVVICIAFVNGQQPLNLTKNKDNYWQSLKCPADMNCPPMVGRQVSGMFQMCFKTLTEWYGVIFKMRNGEKYKNRVLKSLAIKGYHYFTDLNKEYLKKKNKTKNLRFVSIKSVNKEQSNFHYRYFAPELEEDRHITEPCDVEDGKEEYWSFYRQFCENVNPWSMQEMPRKCFYAFPSYKKAVSFLLSQRKSGSEFNGKIDGSKVSIFHTDFRYEFGGKIKMRYYIETSEDLQRDWEDSRL